MKAAQINQFGGVAVIEINTVEVPQAGPGTVLVKVHASSVNPFDAKLRAGLFRPPALAFPFTLGSDVAGVAVALGEDVDEFAVGNQVFGSAGVLIGGSGAFAEYALAPQESLYDMPAHCSFTESAAAVLTGCSAVQAITEHLRLRGDQEILVHGGAGGIGTMAIQVARSIGAQVAATATGPGLQLARELGADEVIDYRTQRFEELVSGYDAVFDTVGGEVFERSCRVLKPGGMLVSMAARDEAGLAKRYGIRIVSQFTVVNRERLAKLADLMASGAVRTQIDKTFALEHIQEAFWEQESGSVLGKVAIEIT